MCETCGCGSHHGETNEVTLRVEGMSCHHCVQSIQKSVSTLPGVNYVVVNLEGGSVKVGFDAHAVSTEAIQRKIEEAGYRVLA